MANPIIKILRGATPPSATLQAGQFAVDQVAKNLYLGVEVGGVVTNEIVGGEGTFATKSYVTTAVTNATGSLGTMSTQNANAVEITGGSINDTTIGATTPSTGHFTSAIIDGDLSVSTIGASGAVTSATIGQISMQDGILSEVWKISAGTYDDGIIGGPHIENFKITGLPEPVNDNDAARKKYVDDKVSALGSVFHYVGDALGSDLTAFPDQTTGSYYKVIMDATYTDGVTTFNAKAGDAFVKTSTGWQKLDNVDVVVSGTTDEIVVTGDEEVGYTVEIDPVFSGRVTTAETDIGNLKTDVETVSGKVNDLETKTQNIDLAGTSAGTTRINGDFYIGTAGSGQVASFEIVNGKVTLNELVNSPSVLSFGTLEVQANNLGKISASGYYMGLETDGALVCTNATPMPIEGFIIDGGVY